MTRPTRSNLVLDGSEVKYRLQAERAHSKSVVHVDWVRFTTLRRNAPSAPLKYLFPLPSTASIWDADYRTAELERVLRETPDGDFDAATQALELANEVAQALGADFKVFPEIRKGHDFYKFRWSIERNDAECAWVGFLSSGDSPRQQAQSKTIHCNIWGSACTFAAPGWNDRIADIVDAREGDLTRADLALDFFDGYTGGIASVEADYKAGLCNSGGKKLKCNYVGDWANGQERSFYIGSKEAGKQTNVYEKGDQLFGPDAKSNWLRFELRYGNKLRVLSSEILRRPADFFAGASDWHASVLRQADDIVSPEPVRTTARLALETVEAEVTRVLRWAFNTAAPTMALAFQFLGDEFLDFVTSEKLPGRLQKFSRPEIARSMDAAFKRFSTVEGVSPAFA